MQAPQIELIPTRAAGRGDAPTELHVLVWITPPQPEVHVLRPPINLALVLDHSGSMAGAGKMTHAREAAVFAVEQLLPTDRVSVTIFDDQVETIVPNTPATDKEGIVARIRAIGPDGTTALHAGWAAGADQAEGYRLDDGLNRVLLLSDGLANVGLTDPAAIAAEVRARRERGVSTTTLGVGDDYNEDLLQAMAEAGDGNYYYVESPRQLADIFQTELYGLMATAGRDVVLALEPRHGVEIAELLNDLEPAPAGPGEEAAADRRWRLPNLIVGMPIQLVVRLSLPPLAGVTELFRARLSWSEPGVADRQAAAKTLIVPAVSSAAFEAMAEDPVVAERVAVLTAARFKLRAGEAMAAGDRETTRAYLSASKAAFAALAPSPVIDDEMTEMEALWADFEAGDAAKLTKRAKHQHYWGTRGRKPGPTPPPDA